jgi:hypothetical protein
VSHIEAPARVVGLLGLCGVLACAAGSATKSDAAGGAGGSPPGSAAGSTAGTGAGAVGGAGGPIDAAGGGGRVSAGDDGPARTGGAVTEDARTSSDAARDESARDGSPPEPGDAGGEVAPRAGCAGTTFALCEDFEGGALDAKLWKLTQNKGTVTLDAARGARGSKSSVHVHVEPGGDTTVGLVESKTFPALKSALFARAFIYIPGAMATSLYTGDRHSRLIYAQGASPYGEYALGIWNGGLIQNHYSKTDDSVDTKMLPPFDEWFCLEYQLDSAAGSVRAYLNDVEITALRHDGWPAANIDTLMFGVDRFGTFAVAEDLWFDDLVVDGARIGCAR